MSFYSDLAADANALITEFGATASLTRYGAATYDPSTGTTGPSQTVQACRAVVFDYDQKVIDGTFILQGDKQVYLSAVGVLPPAPGDDFSWQTAGFKIIAVKPLAPAGTNVLHELQVRSA